MKSAFNSPNWFSPFMQTDCALSCSKKPFSGNWPESDKTSPQVHILYSKDKF